MLIEVHFPMQDGPAGLLEVHDKQELVTYRPSLFKFELWDEAEAPNRYPFTAHKFADDAPWTLRVEYSNEEKLIRQQKCFRPLPAADALGVHWFPAEDYPDAVDGYRRFHRVSCYWRGRMWEYKEMYPMHVHPEYKKGLPRVARAKLERALLKTAEWVSG